jgi:teichuronic acid biosynthesis glycosyltransferase TuaG
MIDKKQSLPLVSVIIPTYNSSEKLRRAVNSVLSQTCVPWELLIIDDRRTDDTRAIIKDYRID